MAYPQPRSMNRDLEEGMSDGKYKRVTPNRGGVTEGDLLYRDRKDLADVWYGIHEVQEKSLPDTTVNRTSNHFVVTKPSEPSV